MPFKLPRQTAKENYDSIVKREVKEQKVNVDRADKYDLEALRDISKEIKAYEVPKKFVLKKLPHNIGHGIFLHPDEEPMVQGELIAPYSGEVSLVAQDEQDDSAYTFEILDDMVLNKKEQEKFHKGAEYDSDRLYCLNLNAEKKGNFTRYINHSSKPNLVAHLIKVHKNKYGLESNGVEVFYFARKKINPGEQLLVCYEEEGDSYWKVFNIVPYPMFAKTFMVNKSLNLIETKK